MLLFRQLFQREQRSLFGEILDWMLTPLLLLWPLSMALTWLVAQDLANEPYDRALTRNAQALAQLVGVENKRVVLTLPRAASEILSADEADIIYYQVLGARGEYLTGERDLPLPPDDDPPPSAEVRLRDDELRGLQLRVAYTWVTVPIQGAAPVLVQVAETREKRALLATEIIKGVMLPQFLLLPLAVLLVWLAIARSIRPLTALEQRIAERSPDDMSPLDDSMAPQEVAPLVQAVNGLLARLKGSLDAQKRFLADAAHQLKTPLAGLRMQADLALRDSNDPETLRRSLQQIGLSTVRATHTVNQLLALARAESGGAQMVRMPCDLAALTREVVQDSLPMALDKRIDLGYEGVEQGDDGATIEGNPTLLRELVRNLIDNALRYAPSSGAPLCIVTARVLVAQVDQSVRLEVEDNGPGVPAGERKLVVEPFYRSLGTNVDGSGLGLSIVVEIARQHHARVILGDTHPDQSPPGLRVTLSFPRD